MEEPEYYQFDVDTAKVAELWRRGSVISSWLLDLTAAALHDNPTLDGLAGRVSDSGEGRWTLIEGIDNAVPMPVLAAALFARFTSRQENSPQMQAVAALRGQFGGHAVQMLDDKADVSPAAEPKHEAGRGVASGNVDDSKTRLDERAAPTDPDEAGPSSGSGGTQGGDGPTSGSGSAR